MPLQYNSISKYYFKKKIESYINAIQFIHVISRRTVPDILEWKPFPSDRSRYLQLNRGRLQDYRQRVNPQPRIQSTRYCFRLWQWGTDRGGFSWSLRNRSSQERRSLHHNQALAIRKRRCRGSPSPQSQKALARLYRFVLDSLDGTEARLGRWGANQEDSHSRRVVRVRTPCRCWSDPQHWCQQCNRPYSCWYLHICSSQTSHQPDWTTPLLQSARKRCISQEARS